LNNLKNVTNITNRKQRFSTVLNCTGGKIDNYILKTYTRDVFFSFSYKGFGGILSIKTNKCRKLKFSDTYILYEKIPGTFVFIKEILKNLKIYKIFKFSNVERVIHSTIKIINKTNVQHSFTLDLLFSICKHNVKNIHQAWSNTSSIIVKDQLSKSEEKFAMKNTYTKLSFKNVSDISYIAINDRYFITAFIIQHENILKICHIFTVNKKRYSLVNLVFTLKKVLIAPQEIKHVKINIYLGPKTLSALAKLGNNIEDNVNKGFMNILSRPLLWLLIKIYNIVNNFGLAIIFLTVLIKLITFPLTKKSVISLQKTKSISSDIQKLKKEYSHDKAVFAKKQMELYKNNNINPMSGCLPIVIQMPVWIALYQMLWNCTELYQRPFILWVDNLTDPDKYYILPILMGMSMLAQNFFQINSTVDKNMKVFYWVLPIFLAIVMINLPSGLCLYIVSNNVLTTFQQLYIKKSEKL
jgi:YidC/Oxa1 family membrane protein insertase